MQSITVLFIVLFVYIHLKAAGRLHVKNEKPALGSGNFFAEDALELCTVLCEFLDALVELVKRHLVLEEGPAELGLVVDERDLGDCLGN